VLALADRIRRTTPARPLLLALTGTPLINDVEDFRAIWQFLGWIDGDKPRRADGRLEETGLTPADPASTRARRSRHRPRHRAPPQGRRRRRPARQRIADLPVELDDELGRSIRAAERELGTGSSAGTDALVEARASRGDSREIDHDHRAPSRQRARGVEAPKSGENVFTMVRRIGQAKAGLAADYAAQLARSSARSCSSRSTSTSWTRPRRLRRPRLRTVSLARRPDAPGAAGDIDAFNKDPESPSPSAR
jgi:hypothetical protein